MDDVRQVVDLGPQRHKLTVHDYHRMGECGILEDGCRVELIEGELIDMAPIGTDHAGAVNGLTRALVMACGDLAVVAPQNPVRLDQFSEPQPDFAVLRPRASLYRDRHPEPADVILLVEVSKSSLRFDKAVKLPLYARAGVGEVWVVDLVHGTVTGHRDPLDGIYRTEEVFAPGQRVAMTLLPQVSVPLDVVFG